MFGKSKERELAESQLNNNIIYWNSLIGRRVRQKAFCLDGVIVGLCDYSASEADIERGWYFNTGYNIKIPIKWDTGVINSETPGALELLEED